MTIYEPQKSKLSSRYVVHIRNGNTIRGYWFDNKLEAVAWAVKMCREYPKARYTNYYEELEAIQ